MRINGRMAPTRRSGQARTASGSQRPLNRMYQTGSLVPKRDRSGLFSSKGPHPHRLRQDASLKGPIDPRRAWKDQPVPLHRANFSPLTGSKSPGISPPTVSHEAEPGHSFRLAKQLKEQRENSTRYSEDEHVSFPDTQTVPVPNCIFDALHSLSGCAARLAIVMIEASYSWTEGLSASSRYFTRDDLSQRVEQGLGMSSQSVLDAVDELEERGWVEVQERGNGLPHAFRWCLSIPSRCYTKLPRELFHVHARISHSALVVLLSVYRATWGWTETSDEGTKHQKWSQLSTGTIASITGLSRPTIRSALDELARQDAVQRGRPSQHVAFFYAPDFSFLEDQRQKSWGESTPEIETQACAHAEGGSRDELSDTKKQQVGKLIELGMDRPAARKMAERRSEELVEDTIRAFHTRKEDISDPGAWLYRALDEAWMGSTVEDEGADVRQTDPTKPLGQLLKEWLTQNQGWEWDNDDDHPPSKNFGGGGQRATADTPADSSCRTRMRGASSGVSDSPPEPQDGVPHGEMCRIIDVLDNPPGEWETVGTQNVQFVPDKTLARWAWRWQGSFDQDVKEAAARKVIQLRKEYES